jgi:hypothetical protein
MPTPGSFRSLRVNEMRGTDVLLHPGKHPLNEAVVRQAAFDPTSADVVGGAQRDGILAARATARHEVNEISLTPDDARADWAFHAVIAVICVRVKSTSISQADTFASKKP